MINLQCCCFIFCLITLSCFQPAKKQPLLASAETSSDTITIIGVGDIMMGTNYPKPGELPPDDGAHLMEDVNGILQNADVTFGNLEGVLLNSGGIPKHCDDPSVCYVFRTPIHYVKNLETAGFDVVSIANNHAGDFGDVGRHSSMKTLSKAGIEYAGQLQKPFTVFEKNGVKYGFTAFAPNSNCNNLNALDSAKQIVAHLDSVADVVIVSFHGGAEGASFQHVNRRHEMFHGEDRGNVYEFAHAMVDAGADVIFGQGPHVTRATEVYKQRFIIYSCGNFCTYGGISVNGVSGISPIVKVYTDHHGQFLQAHITPTYQISHTQVRIDSANRVIKVLQQLTAEYFPV